MEKSTGIAVSALLWAMSCGVLYAQDTVRVLFAGDVMQHQAQLVSAGSDSAGYDFSECFRYVAPQVRAADVAIANLETPLGAAPYSGYPAFCAPGALAAALKGTGFDILLTSNNHSLDRGRRGLVRTVEVLDSLKIPHTGMFRDTTERARRYPLVFEKGGIRFAVLNYTYGTNGIAHPKGTFVNVIDTVRIKKDIAAARARKADVLVACVHWGKEYDFVPGKGQRDLAQWLENNGVQVVIGGHPHVVQPFALAKDGKGAIRGVTVYSLGNYISNQRTADTQGGATATLSFVKDTSGVRITDCSYSLVWVWKPVEQGRERFLLLPVKEAEKGGWPLSEAERARMGAFAKKAREVLGGTEIEVKEK